MKHLTSQQAIFVAEYLKGSTGYDAAIKAGYGEKFAASQASRMLAKVPAVKQAIARAHNKITDKAIVSVQYVLENLKQVVERSMQRAPVMAFDHEEKAMVQTVDDKGRNVWEFDSTGANRALELIGKHLKMFTDKIELDAEEGFFERLERARQRAAETKR